MNNNNLAPSQEATEQWLGIIYQQEFVKLKMYAVRIIHHEMDAEYIVSQGFFKLASELNKDPHKFASRANAKAYLTRIIKNDCCSWCRKKRPVMVGEPPEAIMDEYHFVLELEKQDRLQHILPLIEQLTPQLRQVAMLLFKEGLTSKEVEKRLGLKKDALRVYKNRVIGKLREMVYNRKNTAINFAELLNSQDEKKSTQPVTNLL